MIPFMHLDDAPEWALAFAIGAMIFFFLGRSVGRRDVTHRAERRS